MDDSLSMAKGSRSASISASDDVDGGSVGKVSLGGPYMRPLDAASSCLLVSAGEIGSYELYSFSCIVSLIKRASKG